jgi:hypothetical protein
MAAGLLVLQQLHVQSPAVVERVRMHAVVFFRVVQDRCSAALVDMHA